MTAFVSPAVRQVHPTAVDELTNAHSLELRSLPGGHSEADLHGALLRHLGRFLTEMGRARYDFRNALRMLGTA